MADVKTTPVEQKAPAGMFRVIGIDLANHASRYLVHDYENRRDAFGVADGHNGKRKDGEDAYYVYDDQGNRIRTHAAARGTRE